MEPREPNAVNYTTKELLKEIRDDLVGVRTDVRDRFHKLASTLEALDKRLIRQESLAATHARQLEELAPAVRGLAAEAEVRRELEERADRGFSRREKIAGLLLGIALALIELSGIHF